MLSDNFKYLFEKHGEPGETRRFADADMASIPGQLPMLLKDLYAHYGRFTFRDGRLIVMHPANLADVMSSIFKQDPDFRISACHPFAYTAFGEIFFWHHPHGIARVNLLNGKVFSRNLTSPPAANAQVENGVYLPFSLGDEALDCFDLDERPLFERARKAYGPLTIGECYGFVPMLSLGGAPELDKIKRVQAVVHFSIAAQSQNFALFRIVDRVRDEEVRQIL